jgi:hypothetical protein
MTEEQKNIYGEKEFDTRDEMFAFIRENKRALKAAKKAQVKRADAVTMAPMEQQPDVIKSDAASDGRFQLSVVINTTKVMDSHSDVHIDGLWKKSLKEQKYTPLLKSHSWDFEDVITDEVKATAETMTWRSLGVKYDGETQALVFNATVDPTRNPFMADQYRKGYVRNHSVGMQYVTLYLCMNSDNKYDAEEKANWDKYIKQVVNADDAIQQGYFWAVTEAKIVEGSAVLFGSNPITPTLSVGEPPESTAKSEDNEPPKGTHLNLESIKSLLINI